MDRFMADNGFGDRWYSEDGDLFRQEPGQITRGFVLEDAGYSLWVWCDKRKDWIA